MYILLEKIGLIIAFFFTVGFLLEMLLKWKRRPIMELTKSIKKPGYDLPIVGHVWLIWGKTENILYKGLDVFRAWSEDNFKVYMAARVYIFITKPEDYALTIGTPAFANKSQEYTMLQNSIMGQGLFSVTNMAEWRKNRKLITPAFHFQILKSFIKNFHLEAEILVDILRQKMGKDVDVEVHRPIGLCTLDMITKNAMGVSVNAQNNSSHVFVQGMETVLNVWFTRILKPWLLTHFIFNLTPLKIEHDKAMRSVQRFATEVILDKLEERHRKPTNTLPESNDSDDVTDDGYYRSRKTKAFLDLIIDSTYEGVDERRMRRFIENLRQQNESPESDHGGFLSSLFDRLLRWQAGSLGPAKGESGSHKNRESGCHKRDRDGLLSELSGRLSQNKKSKEFDELNDSLEKDKLGLDLNNNEDSAKDAFDKCDQRTESAQLGQECGDDMDSNNKSNCGGDEKDAELELMTCQLRDEVVTIMVGGQETTACENSFALLMLALHQHTQDKVNAELEEIFGEDSRSPSYDDLQRMEYLECVIKETMRLFPAIPLMAREAQQSAVLTDKSVLPKGCTVCYFIYGLHRDPRYFPDPDAFIPDRFLPENSRSRHPYSFIPFAAGARNCIGQKYAMLQMKTVLSTLLRQFKILPSQRMPTMESIRVLIASTLRSKDGCWVRLEERGIKAKSC